MKNDRRYEAAFLSVPACIILIAALYFIGTDTVFQPPYLLFLLNAVFLGLIPLYVAFIAFRTFKRSGNFPLILLGSGMLVIGACSIVAGATIDLPDGENITVTIHNTAFLAGAILSLLASIGIIHFGVLKNRPARPADGTAMYAGTLAFASLIITAAVADLLPPFFIQGIGATMLRQAILISSIVIFATAAIHFAALARSRQTDFFRWYSLALALFAIGLAGVLLQPSVGSAISWAGRAAQFLGACFALTAVLSARTAAIAHGIPVEDLLGLFFREAGTGYRLIETAPNAIIVTDPGGRVILCNPAAERLFGYSRDTIVGKPFSALIADTTAGEAGRDAGSSEWDGNTFTARNQFEAAARRGDGSRIPVEITLSRHEAGGVWLTTCIIRDLSERRKAMEDLQDSRDLLDTTQHLAKIGGWVWDIARQTMTWTTEAYRIHGMEPGEVTGDSAHHISRSLSCYDPEDRPVIEEAFRLCCDDGIAYDLELPFTTVQGQRLHIRTMGRPVMEGGRVVKVIGNIVDITEQTRMADDLRQSEERLRLAHKATSDVVWDWDVLADAQRWNEAGLSVFGWNEPVERPVNAAWWVDRVHPDDRGRVHDAFFAVVNDPASDFWSDEYRFLKADGAYANVIDRGYVLRDRKGRAKRMIGAILDITSRKQAEDALRESKERYRALIETTSDFIWEVDNRGRYTYCSPQMESLWGMKPEEMIGKTPFDMMPEGEREQAIRVFSRLAESRQPFSSLITSAIVPSGRTVWIEANGIPFCGENGELLGYRGISRDITGRIEADHALRQKQAEIQALIENIPAGLVLFDATTPEYRVLVHNRVYQEFFAEPYRSTGMAGLRVGDYAPDTVESGVIAVLDEVAATQQPKQFPDFPYRSDVQDERWFKWFLSPVVIDGKTVSLVSMSLDVTAQHRAEEALKRAHDELELRVKERTAELNAALEAIGTERHRLYDVLESIPVMVCLLTPDYHVAFSNRSFRKKFGESEGRHCYEYCFGLDGPCPFCESYEPLKTGQPHTWEVTAPDGSVISAHDFPFTDTDGTKMVLEMDIDITEQRRTEQALRLARDQLEERVRERTAEIAARNAELTALNEEKEALLAEIHHRVKNNLASFISLLSLDGTYDRTPQGVAMRNDLQNRARSMALIHDTLYKTHNFSSVDMQFYLSTLVQQIVSSYRLDRDVGYAVDTHGETLDLLRATPVGLIVNELVTNSLKYAFPATDNAGDGDSPCMIHVSLARQDGMYVLTVGDNGVGLPGGFDPKAGKSLGLKLVNVLAGHQLRGSVAFTSDHGVQCRVTFPENP